MDPKSISNLITESLPGTLELGGARMALLDLESGFWSIRHQVENLIGAKLSRSIFQQAGVNGGASFAHNFAPHLEVDSATAFSICLNLFQSAGFGQFEITSLEWPIGQVLIQADRTFEAWMLRQNGRLAAAPCCAYTAGVMVGFINIISERKDVVCIEHTCQGRGDDFCRFELLPSAQASDQEVVALTPDPGLGRQLNLLEMLFERMPMGIAILNKEYSILRYNPTWEDFSARYAPPNAAPLVPGVGYFAHQPGTEGVVKPLFDRVLAGDTIHENGVRLESEGIVTYWDIVLAPLIEQNEINGILVVAVDATEREAARQNLEQKVLDRTRELERRREAAESLREIMAALNSEESFQEIFDIITTRSAQLLRADGCVIFSVREGLLTNESCYNMPDSFSELKSGEIYMGAANVRLLQGSLVQITDAGTYLDDLLKNEDFTDFQRRWYTSLRQHFSSYFAFPLLVRGQMFGGLAFYYRSQRDFDDEDLQLGAMLGEQAALAIENARLHQADQIRQRELQILLDVAETANSSLELDEVVGQTLDLLVALIAASRAGVMLVDEDTGQLGPYTLRPVREIDPEDLARIIRAAQTVASSGEILYIAPNAAADLSEPGALLPLRARGRVLGVLGIIGPEGSNFSPAQLALFKSIADQLGVAIENASLFKNAEGTAIAAERNRLARDLHDAVTQTLFSASMIADVLPKIWERNPDEGRRRLEELRQLTRGALSEMRTLLVELRPAALEDTDLGDLIGHQVNAFTARARIPIRFENNCIQNPPPEIKEMCYRIVQEAFNNIMKHAEANSVQVDLNCILGSVEIVIRDDGVGFDPQSAQSEGLGLGIMVERARAAGADLQIDSQIGKGTQLSLAWKSKTTE